MVSTMYEWIAQQARECHSKASACIIIIHFQLNCSPLKDLEKAESYRKL